MIWQFVVLFFFVVCVVHELAHYFVAKKMLIFSRWSLDEWYWGVGVELKSPVFWKNFVLVGWAGFIATIPFVFLGSGWILICVGLAYIDLLQIFFVTIAARNNPFLQIYPETTIQT